MEDALILALIETATVQAEQFTGRCILPGTWESKFDFFPYLLTLDVAPIDVDTIVVKYQDENNVEQTLSASEYFVRDMGADNFVTIEFNGTIPRIANVKNAVKVEFTAGYSVVPAPIKTAILMQMASMFENRQSEIVGASVNTITFGAQQILFPYIMFR